MGQQQSLEHLIKAVSSPSSMYETWARHVNVGNGLETVNSFTRDRFLSHFQETFKQTILYNYHPQLECLV